MNLYSTILLFHYLGRKLLFCLARVSLHGVEGQCTHPDLEMTGKRNLVWRGNESLCPRPDLLQKITRRFASLGLYRLLQPHPVILFRGGMPQKLNWPRSADSGQIMKSAQIKIKIIAKNRSWTPPPRVVCMHGCHVIMSGFPKRNVHTSDWYM